MLINHQRVSWSRSDSFLIGRDHAAEVSELLDLCPAHRATPLLPLAGLAAEFGVGAVHLKMEGERMGLGSFKGLGGAYAVARLVLSRAEASLGRPVSPEALRSPVVRGLAGDLTVVCASAGNHGLSVTAGARVFGARAVVVLSTAVSDAFAARLREQGAEVVRQGATYEDSMAFAAAEAERRGWTLVSDSSWPGYTATPLDVMRGYTVLFAEAADHLDREGGPATHVFVQAGVGGLAAAAAGYLRERWGERFRLIVVEPEGAPCLMESMRAGRPVRVAGGPTSLGRLDCKEPSLTAFELLARLTDAFMLVSDEDAEGAAVRLARRGASVSPCGAAGVAGLVRACADEHAAAALGLLEGSRVLLIGTEMATGELTPARRRGTDVVAYEAAT